MIGKGNSLGGKGNIRPDTLTLSAGEVGSSIRCLLGDCDIFRKRTIQDGVRDVNVTWQAIAQPECRCVRTWDENVENEA